VITPPGVSLWGAPCSSITVQGSPGQKNTGGGRRKEKDRKRKEEEEE